MEGSNGKIQNIRQIKKKKPDINPTLLITLNVNGLHAPIKT